MKIPFNWMPGSWGLTGKTYKRAKAEYYLPENSYELGLELINIEYDVNPEDNEDIVFSDNYKRAILELDKSFERITESEYQLAAAEINKVPFIRVKESGFDWEQGTGGFWMEFDWNQEFVDFLREHDYTGFDDNQVVDSWLADVYRSQILENELGEIKENPAHHLVEELQISAKPIGDGKVEYE